MGRFSGLQSGDAVMSPFWSAQPTTRSESNLLSPAPVGLIGTGRSVTAGPASDGYVRSAERVCCRIEQEALITKAMANTPTGTMV
ncbi:hypothetical protein W02_10760 [Nitrospira sp. KM1]|nr:hypothetical protein W02_10760 [Nitrospira sp. KM1]